MISLMFIWSIYIFSAPKYVHGLLTHIFTGSFLWSLGNSFAGKPIWHGQSKKTQLSKRTFSGHQ